MAWTKVAKTARKKRQYMRCSGFSRRESSSLYKEYSKTLTLTRLCLKFREAEEPQQLYRTAVEPGISLGVLVIRDYKGRRFIPPSSASVLTLATVVPFLDWLIWFIRQCPVVYPAPWTWDFSLNFSIYFALKSQLSFYSIERRILFLYNYFV